MSIQKIASKSLYIAFFFPLLGTALPVYIWFLLMIGVVCLMGKAQLKAKDIVFVICLALLFVAKIGQIGLPVAEVLFRYFFGYVLVYIYCQVTGAEIDVRTLIKLYCFEVILEAILINTVLPASLWRNYPITEDNTAHVTRFFGFYQRPYSIGTNATISSVILVFLLLYHDVLRRQNAVAVLGRKLDWVAGITVACFMSGGGIVFYLFYWGYRLNLYSKWKNILAFIIFIGLCVGLALYADTLESNHALKKISGMYFQFLVDFKWNQIETTLDVLNRDSWWIGANYKANDALLVWNDFAIRDLTHSLGVLGLGGFLSFVMMHMNRYNWIIGVLAILCVFHYGTVFALSGSIVLAYGLCLNKNKIHTFVT